MNKILLGDLIAAGILSVSQEVEIYLVSFDKAVAFKGTTSEIPQGYNNFSVNGLLAEESVLKIRVMVG